jgi:hypothetical protein
MADLFNENLSKVALEKISHSLDEKTVELLDRMKGQEWELAQLAHQEKANPLVLEKSFSLLGTKAAWQLGMSKWRAVEKFREDGHIPAKNEHLSDVYLAAIHQKATPELVAYAENYLNEIKAGLLNARKNIDAKREEEIGKNLFGILTVYQDTPASRAALNARDENMAEADWKPYLIQGVEHAIRMMRKHFNIDFTPLISERRDSVRLNLQRYKSNHEPRFTPLGITYVEAEDILIESLNGLFEVEDMREIARCQASINASLSSTESSDTMYRVLRVFRTGIPELKIVEGRNYRYYTEFNGYYSFETVNISVYRESDDK